MPLHTSLEDSHEFPVRNMVPIPIHTYIHTFGELHRLLEADSGSGTNLVVLVFSNRAVCVGFWAYSASAVSAAVVFGLFPASPDANFGFLASFWLPLDGF